MRSVEAIRNRALSTLQSMLQRPSMYGAGQGYELCLRSQLADLAYIDERCDQLDVSFDELERRGLWGALGAWGALAAGTGRDGDLTDEIASVYARIVARLGYFSPSRTLARAEWQELTVSVQRWASVARRSFDDVTSSFGEPSYRTLSAQPRVISYAVEGHTSWVSFDFPNGHDNLHGVRIDDASRGATFILARPTSSEQSPEEVYRGFLIASLRGREEEIAPMLWTPLNPEVLWDGAYPPDVADMLADQYRTPLCQ